MADFLVVVSLAAGFMSPEAREVADESLNELDPPGYERQKFFQVPLN